MLENIDVIYYTQDPAALNILDKWTSRRFNVYPVDKRIPLLSSPEEVPGDPLHIKLVLNVHKSEKRVKALTTHHLANWSEDIWVGGNPKDTSLSAPSIMTGLARRIRDLINQDSEFSKEYQFSLEVSHHGPTIKIPFVFVEIGSAEEDWNIPRAGEIIAEALESFTPAANSPVVLGVGGPHYAPNFTRKLDEYRFGHIIPKYMADRVDYQTFVKGIENSTEKTELVLIDWKGLSGPQRQKFVKFAEDYGIEWAKL